MPAGVPVSVLSMKALRRTVPDCSVKDDTIGDGSLTGFSHSGICDGQPPRMDQCLCYWNW